MQKRFFDYDPFTDTTQWFYYDELTDTSYLESIQGEDTLNAQVEASKTLQNDDSYTRKGMKNDMLHYAHIPDHVLMKWHADGINISDRKELFKQVNKPEYSYLKTTRLVHR
jgi:hypothetical protein